jgi:hypothetical protein
VAVHIYTQTIHRTTQITKEQQKIQTNVEECRLCPVFASFTLAFALQLRKKARKSLNQGTELEVLTIKTEQVIFALQLRKKTRKNLQ